MGHDEIAAFEGSGQVERPGWERAFSNTADNATRRTVVTPSSELETTYAQLLDRIIFDRLSDLSREVALSPRSVL